MLRGTFNEYVEFNTMQKTISFNSALLTSVQRIASDVETRYY